MNKKIIICIIYLFSFLNIFSQNSTESKTKMNVLLIKPVNLLTSSEYNYISDTVEDMIYIQLNETKKFRPVRINNLTDNTELKAEEIIRLSADNDIDLILYSNFIVENDNILLTFTVYDSLAGRVKFVTTEDSFAGLEIFDNLKETASRISEKMLTEIHFYSDEEFNLLKQQQQSNLFGKDKEYFFSFQGGINYVASPISNLRKDSADVLGEDNRLYEPGYTHSTPNTYLSAEIYGLIGKNYYGFFASTLLPVIVPEMKLLTTISMGYSFGYNKRHFFKFGASLIYDIDFVDAYLPVDFNMISDPEGLDFQEDDLELMLMTTGLFFSYTFNDYSLPYYFGGGFHFIFSFIQLFYQSYDAMFAPLLSVEGYAGEESFVFPLYFFTEGGYYFNDYYGIFGRLFFSFKKVGFYTVVNDYNGQRIYDFLGTGFKADIGITIGITFRTKNKV